MGRILPVSSTLVSVLACHFVFLCVCVQHPKTASAMCSQNFHLLGPITFLPDNYSLIFFVLLSNKSWYNSICSCEWFLFLTLNWKNSNLIDLQHCSLYLYSLILMSSLKYTNMCMLASYQWDAMLDGNVKPWMTVHSLRSQLTRKLHTHTETCV